jgi:diguanylate cyclase (GGDEF)-like protein
MTISDRWYRAPGAGINEHRGQVPRRALLTSLAALAVPVYASVSDPGAAGEYEILFWLLALVPAFLLAYHRGWRGATLALAVGMGLLALTQAWVAAEGRGVTSWPLLLVVVATSVAIALGVGWISELLHQARDQAEGLALTDELTGIANRRHARLILDQEFAAAQRGRQLAVVLFDLDHFKRYNDRHGHAAGDEALRAFGAVLRQTTRQMNLSARYGGEEFISILSDSDVPGALVFLDRVRRGLADAPLPHPGFTFSAGLATFTPGMKDADELIAAADTALYRAKELGRDQTSVFGSDGAMVAR